MGRITDELGRRVYLDTNIIIYAVEGFVDFETQIKALLAAMDDEEIIAVTSELTIAEVLVKAFRDGDKKIEDTYRVFLTPSPALELATINRTVLEKAARLRATTRSKLPDAINLATADSLQCNSFPTNDDSFGSVGSATIKLLSELSLI